MSDLKETLKEQIIEQLNLEDLTPADIQNEISLFGDEGLGLDSIDALEFIVLLEQHYGIKIEDPSEGKEIFQSVDSLAAYIEKNR
ncbi:MAG: phosphopantetheine-binding protein [Crocinitomicaceae bacterium]|nr:phosphopantetheine-binding protein [Crocinitomicaceae bacterium]